MKLAENQLQENIFLALDGNVTGWTVHSAAAGVSKSDGKRIVIAGFQSIRHGSKNTDGQDIDATLDFWHRARDEDNTTQVMSDVLDILDSYSYSLTGFDVLAGFPRLAFARTLIENTGEGDPIIHGILRLRYVTHEQ